jgi:ABC-type antimicrobial peptide transport system permease subunit
MVLRNLLRRKVRTLLTMLGIAIGVAAIIGLGMMADGLQSGYGNMLAGSKADLVLSQPDAYDISFSSVDERIGEELAAMPEVAAVSGMLQGWSQTEGEPFFFIFGYPADSFVIKRFQIVAGVSLLDRELRSPRGKLLMLGSAAAEVLNKAAGDTMRLSGSVFRIVGIYQTGDAFEDSGAIMLMPEAQALLGKQRQVSIFYIQLKDPDLKERFVTRIERLYADLSLSGAAEYANEQAMVTALRAYVWVVGGLAILIGGVGMMNAQLMAVFERTREIGVLRAVGWSSTRVLWMVMGEALAVSLLGGLLGLAIGWGLLVWLSSETVFLGVMNTNIRAGLLWQAFVVVMTLGLVGGLYPAWRAACLEPVEALRYEGGSTGKRIRRLPFGGMALQSLWQRSLRSLLTLGAISITVGAIMALEAVVRGMASSFDDAFGDVEIMIREANVADTGLSTLDERIGDKLAALPVVHSADGMIFTAVIMPQTGGFFIVFGYPTNSYAIQRFDVIAGRQLNSNRQILLGAMMAEALNLGLDDTLELGGTRYRVVGIYESSVGWEEMGGVLSLRDAQVMAGKPHKVSMFAVKLNDPNQASPLVERINQEFPKAHASLSSDFAEQMPDFERSGRMIDGISLMAILIGGVGVLNTMLMSVFERTREIGVLRSLGWRRTAILALILQEALWLGVLGGLGGLGIAFGLIAALYSTPSIGSLIQPVWSFELFLRAILVALFLGLVGGFYPAFRATQLQPVEALRYE